MKRKPDKLTSGPKMIGASGETIKSYGRATLTIQLGSLRLEHEVTIADICDEVLLGADIIQNLPEGPADFCLSKGYIKLGGKYIPVLQKTPPNTRRLQVIQQVVVSAGAEVVVDVFPCSDWPSSTEQWTVYLWNPWKTSVSSIP